MNDEGEPVAVIGLLEKCETLIELVLVEIMVTNVEVSVNVGAVVKLELVISIPIVFVDVIGVVDVTLDIVNVEPTEIDMSSIVLGMDETDWLIVVFVFNEDDIVDDTGKEELAVINSVDNKVELFKDVDVSVMSFVAKIKEKRFVNIVVSYHIHSNCYQPYVFVLDIVLQRC